MENKIITLTKPVTDLPTEFWIQGVSSFDNGQIIERYVKTGGIEYGPDSDYCCTKSIYFRDGDTMVRINSDSRAARFIMINYAELLIEEVENSYLPDQPKSWKASETGTEVLFRLSKDSPWQCAVYYGGSGKLGWDLSEEPLAEMIPFNSETAGLERSFEDCDTYCLMPDDK